MARMVNEFIPFALLADVVPHQRYIWDGLKRAGHIFYLSVAVTQPKIPKPAPALSEVFTL